MLKTIIKQHFESISLSNIADNTLFNIVWFYAIWLSCVMGQNEYLALPTALLIIHYLLIKDTLLEVKLVGLIVLIGVSVDQLLALSGILIFEDTQVLPMWLIVLWFGFASTIPRSLKFLNKHWLLSSMLGGLGGTTSYLSGYALGAVTFGYPTLITSIILFIHWSILMVLFCTIASWLSKRNS
ncbi:MAG: hypothetical protein ACI93R_000873 [Flavobacteriales bacterium]|jgi:hypothetical protein